MHACEFPKASEIGVCVDGKGRQFPEASKCFLSQVDDCRIVTADQMVSLG